MSYLRNFKKEYRILRNVNNPIIIAGLPLQLALIYLGTIVTAVLIAMILSSLDIHFIINLGIPAIIAAIGIFGIKWFYNKYGLNGFHQTRRDSSLANSIEADISIEKILIKKQKNNETK